MRNNKVLERFDDAFNDFWKFYQIWNFLQKRLFMAWKREITWFQLDSATVSEIFKKSISEIPRSTRRSYQLCKFSAEIAFKLLENAKYQGFRAFWRRLQWFLKILSDLKFFTKTTFYGLKTRNNMVSAR